MVVASCKVFVVDVNVIRATNARLSVEFHGLNPAAQ
jgi:hypothetical protein